MNTVFDRLIENLLHNYECVILPDFGGFIVRDSPSDFNAAKDRLKPFAKHIFFNPHLTQNDGLLYNEIQKTENIPYQEAVELYNEQIAELRNSLELSGSSAFGYLGTFFKGNENHIWFSPSTTLNLSLESYGLFPVDVHKVEDVAIEKPFEKPVSKSKPVKQTEYIAEAADKSPIESTTIPFRLSYKAWLLAASLALIIHIGYLSLEKYDISFNEGHEASVIPSIPSSETNEKPADENNNNETVVLPLPEDTIISVISPEGIIPENSAEVEPAIPPVKEENKSEATSPKSVAQSHEKQKDTLIVKQYNRVAKYKMESNALFHVKDLVRKGINAKVEQNGEWFEVLAETRDQQ